jgi:CelD/BcsL family acetyltransferase involved in cellulose biosynthesis
VTAGFEVEQVRSLDDVPLEEWRVLAARAGHIFATPEWLTTWWRHFGRDRPLVGLVRRDSRLVAIVPLYPWRRHGVPILRFVGHGPSDQLGPICGPLSEPESAHAVAAAMAAIPLRRHVVLAEQTDASSGFGAIIGAQPLYREESPIVALGHESWDAFLATRSRNARSSIRRAPRKLDSLGEVSFRLASADTLDRDLDALFRLHRSRHGESAFGSAEPFHRDVARAAHDRGWLRLLLLELDGIPIAALHSFRFEGTESAYQSGRESRLDELPLGTVLLAHSIREAMADGLTEFRLLRGAEPYKWRFANGDPGLESFALSRGEVAGALVRAAVVVRGRSLGIRRILDRR